MEHSQQDEHGTRRRLPKGGLRILLLIALAGFFAYRWWTLGGPFHAAATLAFGVVAVVGVGGLAGEWRPVPPVGEAPGRQVADIGGERGY